MRKQMRRASIVLLVFAAVGLAAPWPQSATAQANWDTDGLKNGYYWQGAPGEYKMTYLFGCIDALSLVSFIVATAPDGSVNRASYNGLRGRFLPSPSDLTYGRTEAGLDQFFTNPANLPIPIMRALQVIAAQAAGASAATIENQVRKYRRDADKLGAGWKLRP
jgi:hypothetical protein